MKFRNWPCLEIKCEQFGEFLNAKGAGSYHNELKQSMGEFPVGLIDLSQRPFVCLVKCLWQLGQCMLDTCWYAATDVGQLAIYPSEPTSFK